jgi:hypothetical protein
MTLRCTASSAVCARKRQKYRPTRNIVYLNQTNVICYVALHWKSGMIELNIVFRLKVQTLKINNFIWYFEKESPKLRTPGNMKFPRSRKYDKEQNIDVLFRLVETSFSRKYWEQHKTYPSLRYGSAKHQYPPQRQMAVVRHSFNNYCFTGTTCKPLSQLIVPLG